MKGRELQISPSQTIGRADDCGLTLTDYQRVSRQHARLDWDGRVLSIRDMQSTNGLLVNGQQVGAATLREGDQIQLGDFSAIVRLPAATTAATSPAAAPGAPVAPGIVPSRAEAFKSGVAGQIGGWRALGAPQKGGVIGAAVIVVALGIFGMTRGKSAPPTMQPAPAARVENLPSVPAAGASGAPAPVGQIGVAPAVEPVGGKLAPQALESVKAATVLIAHRDGRRGRWVRVSRSPTRAAS